MVVFHFHHEVWFARCKIWQWESAWKKLTPFWKAELPLSKDIRFVSRIYDSVSLQGVSQLKNSPELSSGDNSDVNNFWNTWKFLAYLYADSADSTTVLLHDKDSYPSHRLLISFLHPFVLYHLLMIAIVYTPFIPSNRYRLGQLYLP